MKTLGGSEIVTIDPICECGETGIWGGNNHCVPGQYMHLLPCIVRIPQTVEDAAELVTRHGYSPRVVSVMAKPGVWASITLAPTGPLLPPALFHPETCIEIECGVVDF